MRVADGDGGELKRRVKLGQAGLRQRVPAGHHGGLGSEVDRGVLEADLADTLAGGGRAADRVLRPTAADHRGIGAAPVQYDPAQAAHAVPAELGGRAVRVEEPGLGDIRGRVVEVDAVTAERAAPVAQVADEGTQVIAGGEVARRHRGHEDVVLRAVRVQDLGHPGQPIRALSYPGTVLSGHCPIRALSYPGTAGPEFQALKASCHPAAAQAEVPGSAGSPVPAGPNAG